MNKTYIFLTFAVYGIGGTQIYVRNKLHYLKEHGWDVKVISTEVKGDEPVVVKELEPFQDTVFPELLKNPNLYTKNERKRIIDRVCDVIGDISGDSIIESNFIQVTFWGELLAERLGIRNFIFLIQEDYRIRIKSYLDFYKFKFDRGEFAVNTKYALRQLFDGYCNIPEEMDAYLHAACHNAVEDYDNPLTEDMPDTDYVIGMIGRINKPFVLPVVNEIVRYAKEYSDKSFLLIMMGGSPEVRDYTAIEETVSCSKNVKLMITGPIFPVPFKMISKADVFVSSAGAVITSANCGIVSIAIEANDFQPIGIYGHTTNEVIHRPPDSEIVPLAELLKKVLIEKEYKNSPIYISDWPEIENDFDRHIEFLATATSILEYYNIRRIKPAPGLVLKEITARLKSRFH